MHIHNAKKYQQLEKTTGAARSYSPPQENCCSSVQVNSPTADSCCAPKPVPKIEQELPPLAPKGQGFSWKIAGMDCPSCARKIETAVSAIEGVQQVRVSFATEKLLIDASYDVSQQVQATVKLAGFSLQPLQAAVAATTSRWAQFRLVIILALLMLGSWALNGISPQLGKAAFILTTLIGLAPVAAQSWRSIRSGSPFAIETLMSVAAIGALFIGATAEAAMVLLLFMVGERLEAYAAGRARSGITALMALVPEEVVVVDGQQRQIKAAANLQPGDIIEIKPGSRLPADAELLSPQASFDESALTGESVPVDHIQGDIIAAGSLSVDRQVLMRVVSQAGQNAIDRIIQMIEDAELRRAPIERFIDRFSQIYTPAIMLISLLVILVPPLMFSLSWETWIYRGLTLMLIGCPCALVISTPATITSGLAAASRLGILIKGGAALEQLGKVTQMAFDKTGTLTEGKPTVTDILPAADISTDKLLSLAAAIETGSNHPLALAIVAHAQQAALSLPVASDCRALIGVGVEGQVNGKLVLLSAPGKLASGVLTTEWQAQVSELEQAGKTAVVLLEDGQVMGLLALRDTVRPGAKQAIDALKALGVTGVMLTGDNPRAAAAIAGPLGIDFRASLLPEDKVQAVEALNQQQPIAMIGDGINDAPAMKAATMGIAMGTGTDVALETADAALTHNRLTGLADMIVIARSTRQVIYQNVSLALGLKAVFLVTTLLGFTGLWIAVLADTGATALVTANALRLLKKR